MNQSTTRGQVTEILPDLKYRVALDDGREILAYCASKMKLNKIKVLVGDTVEVILDPYKGHQSHHAPRMNEFIERHKLLKEVPLFRARATISRSRQDTSTWSIRDKEESTRSAMDLQDIFGCYVLKKVTSNAY
jgi:translation initiation factor IF-1